jgi:hypothetical protein
VGCRTSRDDDGPSRRLARPAAATVRLAKRARGRRVRAPANRSSRRRPATAGPGAVGCLRLRFLPGALFGLFKLSASRPREQDHARPHRCHRLIGAQARLLATCASMPGVASTVSLPVVAGGMAVSEPIRAELKTAMAATGATSHPRIARGAENRPVPKAACAYLAHRAILGPWCHKHAGNGSTTGKAAALPAALRAAEASLTSPRRPKATGASERDAGCGPPLDHGLRVDPLRAGLRALSIFCHRSYPLLSSFRARESDGLRPPQWSAAEVSRNLRPNGRASLTLAAPATLARAHRDE